MDSSKDQINHYSNFANSSLTASTCSTTSQSSSTSASDSHSLKFLANDLGKIMDDLSIIDNLYDTFLLEQDNDSTDKQVFDIARQVTLKQQVLNDLLQSEMDYVNDLLTCQEMYAFKLKTWIDHSTDKSIKKESLRQQLYLLFQSLYDIAMTHKSFLNDLKDRMQLWGPTQLISDIFSNLYNCLSIYQPFIRQHSDYVMLVDTLTNIPSSCKLIDGSFAMDKQERHPSLQIQELVYYIQIPLQRLSVYSKALEQLHHYSDPVMLDYSNLGKIAKKYKLLRNEWLERTQDCESHLMVYTALRMIESCPVTVTPKRRLLLFAHLIKVDLDDITLISDTRMYFLYNDALIYCKKRKENNKKGAPAEKRLVYKGSLSLRGAEIRLLAPSFCAKMCEIKKPLFRIGKKSADSSSLASTEAFGFELVTSESNLDAMSPMHQNYQSAMAGAGAPILRRHVMRTKSRQEQDIWFETIRKAIAYTNSQPSL